MKRNEKRTRVLSLLQDFALVPLDLIDNPLSLSNFLLFLRHEATVANDVVLETLLLLLREGNVRRADFGALSSEKDQEDSATDAHEMKRS